jgi:hypothetical protein
MKYSRIVTESSVLHTVAGPYQVVRRQQETVCVIIMLSIFLFTINVFTDLCILQRLDKK